MKIIISFLLQNGGKRYKITAWALALISTIFFLQPAAIAQMANKNTTKTDPGKSDSLTTIHQEIYFNVSPQLVYEALLNSREFSESTKKSFANFSATSAKIDSSVGGTFSVFDGHIIGRTLELLPNQRIVQAWRVVDWPAGVYSIVRYDIKAQGSGTQLIFNQTGFPEGQKEHLAIGWQEHYWDALTKYFNNKN